MIKNLPQIVLLNIVGLALFILGLLLGSFQVA